MGSMRPSSAAMIRSIPVGFISRSVASGLCIEHVRPYATAVPLGVRCRVAYCSAAERTHFGIEGLIYQQQAKGEDA